jgi:hypothetical protein
MNQQLGLGGTLGLVALLALVFGGIFTWVGVQDAIIFSQGSREPQVIRLADLEAQGPGDNIHLTVTDFRFGPNFVAEEKRGQWNRVWIPVFPEGQQQDDKKAIKVLVKTFHVKNDNERQVFYQKRNLTGIITNSIHSLDSSELRELQKGYPGVDTSAILVIEEGRSFPGPGSMIWKFGAGGGMLLTALVCGVAWLILKLKARSEIKPRRIPRSR